MTPAPAPEQAPASEPAAELPHEPEPAYEPEPEPAYEPAEPSAYEPGPAYEEPPALGESVSETTLQVRLPDPPPEPDAHERAVDVAADPAPHAGPRQAEPVHAEPAHTDPEPHRTEPTAPSVQEPVPDQPVPGPRSAQWERVTDKGLPKRTPQVVRPTGAAATPRQGGVDAEALRRRLGGFHQGAKAGRRDVEAELDTAQTEAGRTARTEEMTGDTVEEARS